MFLDRSWKIGSGDPYWRLVERTIPASGMMLHLERSRPTKVFIDNQSARQLAMNPVHHQRSKHIDIKYHWIRDKVAAQEIELVHVPTTEQRADFLTKTLPADVFWRHAVAIMHATYT